MYSNLENILIKQTFLFIRQDEKQNRLITILNAFPQTLWILIMSINYAANTWSTYNIIHIYILRTF